MTADLKAHGQRLVTVVMDESEGMEITLTSALHFRESYHSLYFWCMIDDDDGV